jgi:integrase
VTTKTTKRTTIEWLIREYYKSSGYKRLTGKTQRVRGRILERFSQQHGEKSYDAMQAKHVRKFRDDVSDRPEAANGMIKALRQVYGFAVEYGYTNSNPAADVSYLKSKTDGIKVWSLSEIDRFEETHPIGTTARLALALLLYTGQRRSDVVTMGRQHVRDGWMHVRQQKTGKEIDIPVIPELQKIIDATTTGQMTFLITTFGKPFTSNGFGNKFRQWCDEASVERSAHGLRKATSARLADLGCSAHEIQAITGHTTLKEVERYTKSANQKRLAETAMKKFTGN